jgi:hypothetical protein
MLQTSKAVPQSIVFRATLIRAEVIEVTDLAYIRYT